jgi:hypothetical protein
MRRALGVLFGVVLTVVVSAGPAGAIQPPPHCDPGACIDPIEVVERAACYVGAQLGLQCID